MEHTQDEKLLWEVTIVKEQTNPLAWRKFDLLNKIYEGEDCFEIVYQIIVKNKNADKISEHDIKYSGNSKKSRIDRIYRPRQHLLYIIRAAVFTVTCA